MKPLNERVALVEQKLASMETKVDEMHAVLMQAKGVRWIIGLTIAAVVTIAGLTNWRWVVLLGFLLFTPALAHDSWIMKGGHRNAAGEWCCGEGDCFEVEPVRITANGYLIMATGETVPFSEAKPSQDGKYWRCKRPDGSRRCFFSPPPST